ncbi:Gfo/Idh/MocA family protein [Kineococcus sp. SYSU DK003]|uniref:Gfo/Idh/MocA family protein n=1 Tax=Kineococcus sp. SYSU DK003 TaxID=3383124 RepID=UPI003D7EA88E
MSEKNAPRRIGVGLVSIGWMGKLHTRAYRNLPILYPELGIVPELVQAADVNTALHEYAVDTLGYRSVTTDYHEVLNNPDVDVVSICAPNFLHEEIGVAAAKAGKAFWIEKPVGRSGSETERVAQAADAAGVVTSIGFNYRHAPAVQHAKELIADGTLGRITNVRGVFFAGYSADPQIPSSWRFVRETSGSGVLGDLLGHLADLMHYVVGPVAEVSAVTSVVHTERRDPRNPDVMVPVENEDYAGLLVRFADNAQGAGAVGTLESSRVAVGPRAEYAFEVYGTKGSLRWNFERMNELQLALGNAGQHLGYTTIMAAPGFGDFATFQPAAGTSMGYDDLKVIEAAKFLAAYTGAETDHSNIHDAVASARVLDAAELSHAQRRWVEVQPEPGTTAALRGE